jgi:hypothetical protein
MSSPGSSLLSDILSVTVLLCPPLTPISIYLPLYELFHFLLLTDLPVVRRQILVFFPLVSKDASLLQYKTSLYCLSVCCCLISYFPEAYIFNLFLMVSFFFSVNKNYHISQASNLLESTLSLYCPILSQ